MARCCATPPPSSTNSEMAARSTAPEHLLAALPTGRAVLTGSPTMALSHLNGENVRSMSASGLQLAVTHLNVPVGPVVTEDDLTRALQAGSVAGFDDKVAA